MNADLSRRDTAVLKGFAIVAIVIHNFAHWIPGAVVENEYNFRTAHSLDLLSVIFHGGPHIILNLFSYFGCYGVPVFLFISGYGMVRKYESGRMTPGMPSVSRFALYNARKLWLLMLTGFILLLVYELGFTTGFHHRISSVVYWFLFLSNFLPERAAGIIPQQDLLLGPWWYFSLTMQVYLLYRLLYCPCGKRALILTSLLSVALQITAVYLPGQEDQTMLHYMRYTFLATLLPFALGVWTARYGLPLRESIAVIASAAVMILSLFSVLAWTLAPVAVVFLSLELLRLPTLVKRAAAWTGGISAALFTVHPVVRCFFNPRIDPVIYPLFLKYILVSLLAAFLVSKLLAFIPKPKL